MIMERTSKLYKNFRFRHRCGLLNCFVFCMQMLAFSAGVLSAESVARADEEVIKPAQEPVYHTPLAGQECDIDLMGRAIHIPSRNCDNEQAITLGGVYFDPQLGGTDILPIGALYWRHRWEKSRLRAVVSIFDNELDVAKSFGGEFEILGHLENDTVPFAMQEVVDGKEVAESSIIWGDFSGWLGAGWRRPVSPFQFANDLTLQLFYHAGYLYSKPVTETGKNVRLPPDTFVHGMRVRARYDGFRRNLLELPHDGWAAGMDLELTRRNNWSDANYGGLLFKGDDTRDYAKFSGYLSGAMGIPGLSERDRLLVSIYGGFSPDSQLDRFSAFRLGGGPFPTETVDLYRHPFPGALFDQFPVSEYGIGTVEYRRELLFFLFLHLRETLVWANRINLTSQEQKSSPFNGAAFSVGLTSGFLWDSLLYLEYTYDDGILRNGPNGDSVLVLWSKSF
jgi:hypothetical protein